MTESDIYLQRNIPKNTGGNIPHSHAILSGWGVKEFETISHEDQLMEVRWQKRRFGFLKDVEWENWLCWFCVLHIASVGCRFTGRKNFIQEPAVQWWTSFSEGRSVGHSKKVPFLCFMNIHQVLPLIALRMLWKTRQRQPLMDLPVYSTIFQNMRWFGWLDHHSVINQRLSHASLKMLFPIF